MTLLHLFFIFFYIGLFAVGVLPEEDKDALMHAILDAYAKSKEMNSRK